MVMWPECRLRLVREKWYRLDQHEEVMELLARLGVKGALSEGTTEGAQQVWQNFNASVFTGYDPERKVDDDVIHSAIIGAIVGGTAAGAGRAGKLSLGYNEKVDALGKVGVENPDESTVDRMNRSLAKQLNELDTNKEGPAPDLQPKQIKNLAEVLAAAQQQSDTQRAAIEAEQQARAERLAAAKARRDQFDSYLKQARQLLDERSENYAAVKGVMTTLRAYVDDKSIELPLTQQNEALALIRDLRPIHEKLKAEQDAAAAARVAEAKAQAEREAQERKARIKEEKKALKALDKQRLENLSDDDLAELGLSLGEAVADGAGPEVQAQLDRVTREWQRREKQQLVPTTDEDDLLTVLRRIKLPTRDDSGRGLQGELDSLRNEGVNFGTRQQLFDSKQGSLDRTAERLRGEGFNQIQTPDDVIEFTKRALAGERILPELRIDTARKARSDADQTHAPDDRLPHASQADTPDSFTAHGTFITGSRVTAQQAIRIAARGRAARLYFTESDAGRKTAVGEAEFRRVAQVLPLVRGASSLLNTQTGRSLPEIGRGQEAFVYEDAEQGVVYKVYTKGHSAYESIGMRVAIDEGMAGLDTGQPRDVIEKAWAINELGGTPTEIVGFTQDGEIVVKQPRGNDAAQYERAQVLTRAHLQEVPSEVLPRIDMRSPLYYSHIAGQDVLLGDLHGKNFIGDTIGRGRINDLATHVLTEAELQKLPKLNGWINERRSAARAQGSADFAKRGNTAEGRGGNDSAQSMAADTVRDLVMTHNLTEENLLHAKKMGGLATPSFAITQGKPPENFGEITLIGSRELVKPKRDTQVFGADVFSTQYPEIQLEIDTNAYADFAAQLAPYRKQVGGLIPDARYIAERGFDGLEGSEPLMAQFMHKQGLTLPEGRATRFSLREKIESAGKLSEYHAFVREELAKMTKGERIRQGSTAAGRPRYIPHTLENVVKILKKGLRGGAGMFGVGTLRSHLAPQFKSIAAIRENKDRLVTREQVEQIREEIQAELFEVMNTTASQLGFNDRVYFLEEAAKSGIPRAAKAYNLTLDTAQQTRIADFLNKLREMPTEYFEGKLLRAVQVGEFSAAVVPDTIGTEALAYLREQGLKDIRTYDPNVQGAQAKAVGDYQHLFFAREVGVKQHQRQLNEQAKTLRDKGEQAQLVAEDFKARIERIAPALMMRYQALVGDYDSLFSVGIRPEQLDGSEQAAHIVGAKTRILWFLQQNLRADKNGLMDERLRRDMLHESAHAWLNTLETDRKEFLFREWQRDLKAKDGWLAQMRKDKVELREGVETDWAEYWAERIAYENSKWAGKRERWAIAGDRGLLAQIYAEFRQFLADAIDLLQRAFTRTKRYNIDFRSFLTDTRYDAADSGRTAAAVPQTVAAARETQVHGKVKQALEARAKATYERAQSRGNTQLSFKQWRQAHSPEFKNWFGDWQALRAQQRIDAMQPVELQLDEKLRNADVKTLRQEVTTYLRSLANGKTTANHLELGEVGFSTSNIGKVINTSATTKKLQATRDIVRVIEQAHLIGSQLSSKKNEAIQGVTYHTLAAKVRAFGHEFITVVTLKEASGGKLFYNNIVAASTHEKAPSISPRGQQSEDPVSPTSALHGAKKEHLQPFERVNPESVSKVVDPHTGEPRVVYHGTGSKFTQFNTQDLRFSGIFFSESQQVADGYTEGGESPNVMAAYLDLKKPLYVKAAGKGWNDLNGYTEIAGDRAAHNLAEALHIPPEEDGSFIEMVSTDEVTRWARRKGFDGVIFEDIRDGGDGSPMTVYTVFRSEQVKSATGNRGTFDADNPDITFSRAAWDEVYSYDLKEGYERFFHGSNEGLGSVEDSGPFGGVFASQDYGAARSHGAQMFVADIKAEEVASNWDIMNAPEGVLDRVYTRTVGKDWRQHAELLERAVEEDKGVHDFAEDEVLAALGGEDLGEAAWQAQYVRGLIAKELGFKAVPMKDEHGTSYLVLPEAELRSVEQLKAKWEAGTRHGQLVHADFARKADEPSMLSDEQRLARALHELEELNYRIDELKNATTRQQKAEYRQLLGERNEKRMFIDEAFSGWRKTHPELADGQVVDPKAARKRILEKDLKQAEEHAERGNTFAEKHAEALRRTLQREYPARVDGSSETQARPPYVRNDSGNAAPVVTAHGQVNNSDSKRAQARAELASMSPVSVSGLDPALTGKPLREAAHDAYKGAADKGPVRMRDGRVVELTTVGFKKVRSHSADRKLLDLFTSIREVLEKAVPIASLPHVPADHTDSIKAWHYYGAKVAFGKQELYAKLVVRESVNGEIYYDTNFSGLEEAVARDRDAIPDKPEAAPRLSDDMHTLGELLDGVKEVSDLSQSGEPLAGGSSATPSINEGRDHSVVPPLLGHTNIPPKPGQTVWQWLTDFIKGFRNFVPEVSPRDPNYAPLRQFYKAIKRATPQNQARVQEILGRIVQPLLEGRGGNDASPNKGSPRLMGKAEADTYRKLGLIQQRIRKLEKAGEGKPEVQSKNLAELARLHAQVVQLNAQLEAQPYHLFNKLVLAEDYVWRAENLKDQEGQPLALPDGITLEEAKAEAARLQALATAHPNVAAINRAVQSHLELVAETWAELERRFPELKAVPTNPYYFPHHIINDKHPAKLARVRLDTAEEIRKYLIEPKGSTAPIETDYAKAMSLHLSAVYAHNSRADLVRDLIKRPFDKMDELRERAKELSEEGGERVSWQDVFKEEYKHSGYVAWEPDDRLHLHSEAIVSREKIAKRLGVALGDGDLQTELAKAGITQVQLLPTDIREALTPTAKEEWIIPEKVAQALEAMIERESRYEGSDLGSGLVRSLEAAQNLWKKHILFSPWNYIRYEYNNTTSDLEKLFSADPAVFGYLPSSLREVMDLFAENPDRPPTVEARIAKALGVMQSVTIREAGDLPQLKQFAALKARPERLRDIAKAASTLFLANGRSTIELSQLREATFRYAKFKADLDRMRNGARPVYAGAYHKDIDALVVTEDHLNTIRVIEGNAAEGRTPTNAVDYLKAAEISLATFGDYDTISVSGQALRKMMIPFYSWIEINFRYHANLFRNLKDMAVAGELSKADARKAGARAAGVLAATFTRRVAAYTAGRLLLPYLAVAMWNNSGDNEEIEDELSEADRRRFHINLGRDKDGRARVVYAATALGDVMKWFGGDDLFRLGADLLKGRTTLAKAVEHYSTQFLPDLVNNLAGGIGPVVKAGYTLASGKSTFPDITDQRTIPAYDLKWNILSQMTDGFTADMIRRVLDKDYLTPRDLGDWAQQLILQVRKRDAASWSFYAIKDKAADWNERRTGKSRGSSEYNSPEMQVLRNYRRAIYRGDVKNAMRFYDRLLEFGYTAERLRSSIRSQDPLSEIPKEMRREFVASLSPFERRQLERAYIHYAKMNSLRGYETQLFPRANTPPAWRARHKPRYNILERQITGHRQLTGEELAKRAHRAMMESLRP